MELTMITLRQIAVAFLFHSDKLLVMEKPKDNGFMSGMVVPIGGHLEANELSTPKEACLREIEEETGLTDSDLSGLELRYIIIRIKDAEIRIQYVYFSSVKHFVIKESEEGNLLWVDVNKIAGLNMTATTQFILEHYSNNGNSPHVYVGTMRSAGSDPAITWAVLDDWEKAKILS